MGLIFGKLFHRLFGHDQVKVVIVGLNNAGKTTILYKLHLGEVVTTQPTIGSNVETIQYRNVTLECWDLGGQERLRSSWNTYYNDTKAVIFVVDSTDRKRLPENKKEVIQLLASEDLKDAIILVLANKQDVKGAMSAAEVADALSLHSVKSHQWHIQACCGLTGDGLYPGLDWITNNIQS
eukprot:Rmarinus@m.23311